MKKGGIMQVVLGDRYKDSITGWEGVAVGRYEYLNGCIRIGLETMHDGEPKEMVFDEQRIISIETQKPVDTLASRGGPQDHKPPS